MGDGMGVFQKKEKEKEGFFFVIFQQHYLFLTTLGSVQFKLLPTHLQNALNGRVLCMYGKTRLAYPDMKF